MLKGKYSMVYLFLFAFLVISFISGYVYYQVQPKEEKVQFVEQFDIEENLSYRKNTIFPSLSKSILVLVCSLCIIPSIVSIFILFYDTFSIAFIFHLLCSINGKMAFFYSLFYYIIPLFFYIWLLRIGFSISISLITLFVDRKIRDRKRVFLLIKKFLLVVLFLTLYQILMYIFSLSINTWLLALLS